MLSNKIYKHTIGTNSDDDKLIFVEEDETFISNVYKSKSKKYIIIGSYSTVSTEFRIVPADCPNEKFKIFEPRRRNHEYSIEHKGNSFLIVTNKDTAKNFKLMKCTLNNTESKYWEEILPNRNDVLLEDIEVFKEFIVVNERKKGLTQFRVLNFNEKSEHTIEMGEEFNLIVTEEKEKEEKEKPAEKKNTKTNTTLTDIKPSQKRQPTFWKKKIENEYVRYVAG